MKDRRFRRAGALLAILLAAALLCTGVFAADSVSLQPSSSFYVLDNANVLETSTENTIIAQNETLYNACGAQIVVVTVNDTEGYTLEQYAYLVANKWGIGSAEKNNGVLLMLDIAHEDYQCLQGSGLETLLPTTTLSRILQEDLEPDFAAGTYDAGVQKTFAALYDQLASIYNVTASAGTAGTAGNAQQAAGQTQNGTANDNGSYNYNYQDNEQQESGSGVFSGVVGLLVFLVVIVVLISIVSSIFRPRRYTSASGAILPFLLGLNFRPYRRSYWDNPFGYSSHYHHSDPPPFNANNFNGGFSGGGLFGSGFSGHSGGHSGGGGLFGGGGSSFGGGGSFGGGHSGGFSGGGGGFRGGGAGRGH